MSLNITKRMFKKSLSDDAKSTSDKTSFISIHKPLLVYIPRYFVTLCNGIHNNCYVHINNAFFAPQCDLKVTLIA